MLTPCLLFTAVVAMVGIGGGPVLDEGEGIMRLAIAAVLLPVNQCELADGDPLVIAKRIIELQEAGSFGEKRALTYGVFRRNLKDSESDSERRLK
jgi:hypothetical protein